MLIAIEKGVDTNHHEEIMQNLNCRIIGFIEILHMMFVTCLYLLLLVFVSFCTFFLCGKFLHSTIPVSNRNIKRHDNYESIYGNEDKANIFIQN